MDGIIETKLYDGKVAVKFLGPTEEMPNRHIYMVDGKRKTGVTTIIGMYDKSNALVSWATELAEDYLLSKCKKGIEECDIYDACSLHAEKKKTAADIGTKTHDWIEKYIKGEKPEMPEEKEVQIAINAFLDWIDTNKVKIISTERVIYSRKHDFVGKLDLEAKVNGKRVLVDFKTSGAMYNTFNLQTAAYLKADEEENGEKYDGRWILRLAKETEKDYKAKFAKKNRKRELKGQEPKECPPYQAFEAKFLDNDTLERDYKAFLACKILKDYDNETGYYATLKK